MMEEKYVLTMKNGDEEIKYLIERVIRQDENNYFTIFNFMSGDFLFGEYLGELPEDEDLAREIIWRDFLDGCKHISYPDGYIVDDLYNMIDSMFDGLF